MWTSKLTNCLSHRLVEFCVEIYRSNLNTEHIDMRPSTGEVDSEVVKELAILKKQ
jgi:hypothetical protein